MIKKYNTTYEEDGQTYKEYWWQLNLFGKCFCFAKKKYIIIKF